jgi:hypothetical protein
VDTANDLAAAHCPDVFCSDYFRRR